MPAQTKILTINYSETSSNSLSDLTGYTWVGNTSLSIDSDYSFSINFINNNNNFDMFIMGTLPPNPQPDSYIYYVDQLMGNDIQVYELLNGGWLDNTYKTIEITGGTDATNQTLIDWLQANGTLQTSWNQYEITETLTNLTSGNKTIRITPDTGYYLPSSITVTNGTLISYNSTTGIAVISGDNAVVTAECSDTSPAPSDCLRFSSTNTFTLNICDLAKFWDGTLHYSTDYSTWNIWNGATTLNSSSNGDIKYLYIRGSGNTYITGENSWDPDNNYSPACWVLTGSNIRCDGNIENLLDYQTVANGNHPAMASECYRYLFYECANLISAPELPSTTLANYCYQYMFSGCTSLTTAPTTLPATTLAHSCYEYMFDYCTSLVTAPSLPATTLADYCYQYMFIDCTSLTTAPSLSATTLTNQCYRGMFSGCTSLTTAPELPATTLAANCYSYMFADCTSLTTAPTLPATTLATYCYYYMFYSCSKIKLSSTQTEEYTQQYRIPTSGTGTTATSALSNMFGNTGGTFTGTPTINTTYYLSNTNTIIPATTGYSGNITSFVVNSDVTDSGGGSIG